MSFLLVLNRIWIQIDLKAIDVCCRSFLFADMQEIDKKLSQLSQRGGGEKITFDFKKARESVSDQAHVHSNHLNLSTNALEMLEFVREAAGRKSGNFIA